MNSTMTPVNMMYPTALSIVISFQLRTAPCAVSRRVTVFAVGHAVSYLHCGQVTVVTGPSRGAPHLRHTLSVNLLFEVGHLLQGQLLATWILLPLLTGGVRRFRFT